jgi:DNA topoisomerase-1
MTDVQPQSPADTKDAADAAGLRYVSADGPGLTRRRAGKGFSFVGPDGQRVVDRKTLERIRGLVIPPAWRDVWICPRADGHIQAIGYDEKGRKQYLYHPRFREVRDEAKFEHVMAFAEALPALRERVAADMAKPGLGRDTVLATVAHLLETTMIRVGNASYARDNGSYGLTTLRVRHVKVEGTELRFHFKGKSGKVWKLSVKDRRVARIVKACQDLPGQDLFQYIDDEGARQSVTSADVNAYLKQASGGEITAKNFRTWMGTVLAATALAEFGAAANPTEAKKNLTRAINQVAAQLGNTATVCRKCYVHPAVMAAYLDGALDLQPSDEAGAAFRPEEAAVLAFLRGRSEGEGVGAA